MRPFLLLTLLAPFYLQSASFPSASSAIILPGQHQSSQDLQGYSLSPEQVIDWEINNSDLIFGSYAEQSDNARTQAVGYMYNQKLELNAGWTEHRVRQYAETQGIDYEDFFLHFTSDTIVAEVDPTHGEKTSLNRKPMIVGHTADAMHAGFWLYQSPPWNADVFAGHQQGGALYVYHSEQFDRLTLKFSQFAQGGEFWIEYPSATDSQGMVTQWARLDIKNDKTNNMTKNQTVIWNMPDDWQRAATHDGSGRSYGGGQYFGSTYLRDGGQLFVARIRWHDDNSELRPRIDEVKLRNSFPVVKPSDGPSTTAEGQTIQRWRKVRGFDASADLNQDNYLSPFEYKNRSNKNATARFRWESRVIPFGRMWNQSSSWALTHLGSQDYLNAIHSVYQRDWQEQGLSGAYNDDTNKLIGGNQFVVYSGGHVAELDAIAGSKQAQQVYQQQFANFLLGLSELDSDALISVNIGTANLYGRNGQSHLIESASLYLREHYLFPSTGFSGYAGLSKFWDNSALAHAGKKVIYQATTRYGRVEYFGNNQDNWQQDQYSALAAYYLNHHNSGSLFNQWNNGYLYGSDNTTESNFYQSGIAKNIAYQPTALLSIDLGEPANHIPSGFDPIPLMLSTQTPSPADYTIVGNSANPEVVHADLPEGIEYITPTHTYFLYRSAQNVVSGGPAEMVLAREFTKGKVLYRTDFHGKNRDYYSAQPVTITLDEPMRPVDQHGNVGDYVSEVELAGYQGLFLLY